MPTNKTTGVETKTAVVEVKPAIKSFSVVGTGLMAYPVIEQFIHLIQQALAAGVTNWADILQIILIGLGVPVWVVGLIKRFLKPTQLKLS